MMPHRPDLHEVVQGIGLGEGRSGSQNTWVIDTLQKNDVLVVDLFGKVHDGTFIGDNLATATRSRTGTGIVIDGGIRDFARVNELADFAVFCRGVDPTAIADVTLVGVNVPIRIGHATVLPGDVVLGTAEGITFVPPHLAEGVVRSLGGRSPARRLRQAAAGRAGLHLRPDRRPRLGGRHRSRLRPLVSGARPFAFSPGLMAIARDQMIHITPEIALDESELEERFVRSSGPGGQNVNKVSTAVQLRFDARNSPSLPDDVRDRLLRLAGRLATDDGVIVISAQRFRTQERNRQDALERLIGLIRRAAIPPVPRTPTKPSRASRQRRLDDKLHRARTKSARAKPGDQRRGMMRVA